MSYQYKIAEDSNFGKILFSEWQKNGYSSEELQNAIESHLNYFQYSFFSGTPRARKQVLMNTVPVEFRRYIEKQQFDRLLVDYSQLLSGSADDKPCIDIALEIFEWLMSGFEQPNLLEKLMLTLVNHQLEIPSGFMEKLKARYLEIIAEEMNS